MNTNKFLRSSFAKQLIGALLGVAVAGVLYIALQWGGDYRAALLSPVDTVPRAESAQTEEQDETPSVRTMMDVPSPAPDLRHSRTVQGDDVSPLPPQHTGAPLLNESGPREIAFGIFALLMTVITWRKRSARTEEIAVS